MSVLAAEGHSLNQVIEQQLQKFLQLQKLVARLYNRSTQVSDVATARKNIDKATFYDRLKQDIRRAVQKSAPDFVYYERALSRVNYCALFSRLLKLGEDICKNGAHSFYSSRKEQVAFINDVVVMLSTLSSNLQQHFNDLNIHGFILFQDMNDTRTLVQKIKFSQNFSGTTKLEIRMNFSKNQNNFIKNEPKRISQDNEIEACQASHTVTTRPSSTGKSSRLGKKAYVNNNPIIQATSETDCYIREHKRETNPIQVRPTNSLKSNKFQRCKTAKGSLTYRKNLEKLKSAENVEHFSSRNSKSYASFHEIANQNHEIDEKNQIIEQKYHPNSSIQRWGTLNHSKKESHQKVAKKHRNAFRDQPVSNQYEAKIFLENQAELNKIAYKNQKGSLDIGHKQSFSLSRKRNYQSHQNEALLSEKKYIKKFKPHQPNKRKNNHFKNQPKFMNVAEQAMETEMFSQENKDIILLIKPPEQKLSETKQKSYILKNSLSSDKQAQINTQKQIGRTSHKKKKKQLCSLSNSENDCDENENFAKTAKVDLTQINAIRADFIKTRANVIPFSDNQEGSTFFIQQNFLSHRENFRFQSYLKRLKESNGDQFQKQPFNLEYEAEQVSSKRLIEIERFYTFRSENDWIRDRFHNGRYSQQAIQLAQAGFQIPTEEIV